MRPSTDAISRHVLIDTETPFTYGLVGATQQSQVQAGWFADQQHTVVGSGAADFQAAVEALQRWTPFDLDWVWPVDSTVPIQVGQCFAFLARTLGVWSVNVCRIVYVIDEQDETRAQFGFAYGTLPSHSLRGEERFLVTWDKTSDEVHFDIKKFSQPASPVIRLVSPITQWIQVRFTREALRRLAHAVAST
jgi:uncharacterized protein (UPF0548 family)